MAPLPFHRNRPVAPTLQATKHVAICGAAAGKEASSGSLGPAAHGSGGVSRCNSVESIASNASDRPDAAAAARPVPAMRIPAPKASGRPSTAPASARPPVGGGRPPASAR